MSIAAPIAERYFAERYKSLLLLLFAVQLLLFGAYTLSLPIGRSPAAVLPSSGMSLSEVSVNAWTVGLPATVTTISRIRVGAPSSLSEDGTAARRRFDAA